MIYNDGDHFIAPIFFLASSDTNVSYNDEFVCEICNLDDIGGIHLWRIKLWTV